MLTWKRWTDELPPVGTWVLGAWWDSNGPSPHWIYASLQTTNIGAKAGDIIVDDDSADDFYRANDATRHPDWWATINDPETAP